MTKLGDTGAIKLRMAGWAVVAAFGLGAVVLGATAYGLVSAPSSESPKNRLPTVELPTASVDATLSAAPATSRIATVTPKPVAPKPAPAPAAGSGSSAGQGASSGGSGSGAGAGSAPAGSAKPQEGNTSDVDSPPQREVVEPPVREEGGHDGDEQRSNHGDPDGEGGSSEH